MRSGAWAARRWAVSIAPRGPGLVPINFMAVLEVLELAQGLVGREEGGESWFSFLFARPTAVRRRRRAVSRELREALRPPSEVGTCESSEHKGGLEASRHRPAGTAGPTRGAAPKPKVSGNGGPP